MEYLPGGDLMAHVREHGVFAENEAKGIVEQILQALFILHGYSYAHRDIKPDVNPTHSPSLHYRCCCPLLLTLYSTLAQNILIAGTNPIRIKVGDFGQTKRVQGSYNSESGTRAWAAPEQTSGNYNPLMADMWGVGCVVYFLMTSLYPFLADNKPDKSPMTVVKMHIYPGWPRVTRRQFQEDPSHRIPGDQIIVRDVSNEANDFLRRLIVRDPVSRMPVHTALQHPWICKTSPLESALRAGDLPLSRQLALHDSRYKRVWESPESQDIRQIVLRFAAANGHRHLVGLTLQLLPIDWALAARDSNWPNIPHALIGAAQNGNIDIVNDLAQQNLPTMTYLSALVAALRSGHQRVAPVLMRHIPMDMVFPLNFAERIASHGDRSTMTSIINSTVQSCLTLDTEQDFTPRFRGMLLAAARNGKIVNLQLLLSLAPTWPREIRLAVLRVAAESGHLNVIQYIRENYPARLPNTSSILAPLLTAAAGNGHVAVVEYLLWHGARPDLKMIRKAASSHHRAIVQLLINALIVDGSLGSIELASRSIAVTITSCHVSLLQWLNTPSLSNVCNISQVAKFGDLAAVEYLLGQKCLFDRPGMTHAAALSGAAQGGHIHIIEYLHIQGLDIMKPDPWYGAAQNGHFAVIQRLLVCGKPAPEVMMEAVRLAVEEGHLGVVVLLLHNGAVWNGPCEPLMATVVAAFATGAARPEIGAPASSRRVK